VSGPKILLGRGIVNVLKLIYSGGYTTWQSYYKSLNRALEISGVLICKLPQWHCFTYTNTGLDVDQW
jgi:hypothetical protein